MNAKTIIKKLNMDDWKINRFSLLFLTALICFALSPCLAFANPPSDLTLSYDADSQTLKVDITHTTNSPDKHYIKKVEITKNGTTASIQEYQSQPSQDKFSYEYKMAIGDKDIVEVKATCSIFGSKKQKLSIVPGKEPR